MMLLPVRAMPIAKDIIDRTLSQKHGESGFRICEKLLDAGFEGWWVGGSVRDMLLGLLPDDIDIATDAKPKDIVKLFPKCDDSRADLGAVIVSLAGHTFELTTYREETQTSDGREPASVRFTTRKEDAKRRDITINAMYWNPISRDLFDPFNGETDLHEKLIRIIGDPDTRLTHDALRLLRVIRFRAAIGGQYHPETFQALHRCAKLVKTLSGFRAFQEIEKTLLCPHPEVAFEDYWETDILEHLLPELHACRGIAQPMDPHTEGDVWNHIIKILGSFTPDHEADVRIAALFHDIGKSKTFSIQEDRIHFNEHAPVGETITRTILDRMQCPVKRKDKICWLVGHHMMMGTFENIDDERKAHWYYHPWFIELLQLFWLDIAGTGKQRFELYESIVNDYNHFLDRNPRPEKALISGEEVMEILGIQPGAKVGEILKSLHDAQIAKKVNTKKEARQFSENLRNI